MSYRTATFKVSLGEVLRHLTAERLEQAKQVLVALDRTFPHFTDEMVAKARETWPGCEGQLKLIQNAENDTEAQIAIATVVLVMTMAEIAHQIHTEVPIEKSP